MAWVNIIDLMYPVGTIYTANTALNSPASLFGGTWVALSTVSPFTWKRVS